MDDLFERRNLWTKTTRLTSQTEVTSIDFFSIDKDVAYEALIAHGDTVQERSLATTRGTHHRNQLILFTLTHCACVCGEMDQKEYV